MSQQVAVLFVGLEPASLGLSDTGPGPSAATIQHGIDTSMTQLDDAGYAATWLGLETKQDPAQHMKQALEEAAFDCVVIGAGIRLLPENTALLETLIAVVREATTDATIAFNTQPSDSLAAVQRHFPRPTH